MARLADSLRARLTLGFFAVAVTAVGLVSAAVLPGLERRLVDAKLGDLAKLSAQYSGQLKEAVGANLPQPKLKGLVRRTADAAGVRVTVLLVVYTDAGILAEPTTDSAAAGDDSLDFPVAVEAARTRRPQQST
ncbi:MAG: hypothetical protein H0T96_07455, partial [Thermoleophilaceae bacterium]|nr:hypothetical protein [Thermoleophilaceae bacterium]